MGLEDTDPAQHTPVLLEEVIAALRPDRGDHFIDGTLGAGGHAWALLNTAPENAELLGIDRDPAALALAKERLNEFQGRVHLRQGSYHRMDRLAAGLGWDQVDGILLDLGLSSMQLDDPERGFAFRLEGPLDMRFGPGVEQSAEDLVNNLREEELAQLIVEYGEDRQARRIARAIVEARPLHSTTELAGVISRAVGRAGGRIHPATRTFQALRIAVNQELEVLENGLETAIDLLRPGGRMAVIAFHSLEDRIVKNYFRRESQDCICPPEQPICTCDHQARLRLIGPKPIMADEAEIERNRRARSARLRVAERLALA